MQIVDKNIPHLLSLCWIPSGPGSCPRTTAHTTASPCTWQAGGDRAVCCLDGLLVKTQTESVSLLSPFPSHPPPFSSRVTCKELYFSEKVSHVHTYLFCPFWSAEACRGMFDSPLLQKTCRTDCCRNCLESDLRKRINPECLMSIMC